MCKIPYFLHIPEFLDGFHSVFPSGFPLCAGWEMSIFCSVVGEIMH